MISYKVKGIILVVIISLASIMMPFSVYADTISSSNVIGVNVELLGSTTLEHREDQGNNYYYKQYSYKAVIELDNSYVGVIGARVQGQYYEKSPVQGSQLLTQAFNYYRKIFVNGNSAEMTFVVSTWYSSVQDPINYRSDGTSPYITIEDSNVTKFEDIDSIEQIIDLLSDIYQNSNDIEGLSTNQLTELQNIVSNTSLANDYLDIMSQLKQWHTYTESYPFIISLFRKGYNTIDLDLDVNVYSNYLDYPIFVIPSGSVIENRTLYSDSVRNDYYIVFGTNESINNISDFERYFNFNNGDGQFSLNYETVWVSSEFRIIKITIHCLQNGTFTITANNKQRYFMPIVSIRKDQTSFSTDFSLMFKFSNALLDNIQIIANGTSQSNSAASDLEQEASEYSDIADDVIGIEEGLTSNFETSVNQIDLNSGLSGFGGNFMTSATWVRTQFNRLTENTPYGSLVVYGLTLGFVLLMLGKVLL